MTTYFPSSFYQSISARLSDQCMNNELNVEMMWKHMNEVSLFCSLSSTNNNLNSIEYSGWKFAFLSMEHRRIFKNVSISGASGRRRSAAAQKSLFCVLLDYPMHNCTCASTTPEQRKMRERRKPSKINVFWYKTKKRGRKKMQWPKILMFKSNFARMQILDILMLCWHWR